MELRRLLQTTVRGGQSCNEFFEQMHGIADQLMASGEPVPDSDLVRYILNGLGPDFNSFVVAVTTRAEPLQLLDLHSFLLTHESLMSSQYQPVSSHNSDPVALYSQSQRSRGRGQYRGRGGSQQQPPLLPTPTGRGRGGPNQPTNGRGAQSSSQFSASGSGGPNYSNFQQSHERPTCQICFKRGHSTLICHHIFNHAYSAEATPQFQALYNTTTTSPNEGWFLDSGATHHVTSDINNLCSLRSV